MVCVWNIIQYHSARYRTAPSFNGCTASLQIFAEVSKFRSRFLCAPPPRLGPPLRLAPAHWLGDAQLGLGAATSPRGRRTPQEIRGALCEVGGVALGGGEGGGIMSDIRPQSKAQTRRTRNVYSGDSSLLKAVLRVKDDPSL